MAITPSKIGFLDLPVELRNEIYRNLLTTKRTKRYYGLSYSSYHMEFSILRTNRQIYHEAQRIFRENKFIRISTPWPAFQTSIITEAKFPLIARCGNAMGFQRCYLQVILDYVADSNTKPVHDYYSCLDDLPTFCENLFFFNCMNAGFTRALGIGLHLRDPYKKSRTLPKVLQEQFLMPFAVLKDLDRLVVGGHDTKEVENQLRDAMKIPNPTVCDYLERAAKLKDSGNEEFKAGKFAQSISLYYEAYEAMQVKVDKGTRFAVFMDGYFTLTELRNGRYAGKRGDLVRHQLGSHLNFNLIQAYLKLEDWNNALKWGERAIDDIERNNAHQFISDGHPSLITDAEKSKAYYRTALACNALGKAIKRRRNLLIAQQYAPDDPNIKRELRNLQESWKEKRGEF